MPWRSELGSWSTRATVMSVLCFRHHLQHAPELAEHRRQRIDLV
jgi:hypothetical protein